MTLRHSGRQIPLTASLVLILLSSTPALSSDQKSILMVLWRGETSSETIFLEDIRKEFPDINIDKIDGKLDRNSLSTQLRKIDKKYDLIYSFGTTSTQLAKAILPDTTPILFNILFDPDLAKITTPDTKNITGIKNGVPVSLQLTEYRKLSPFNSLLFLYNPRDPNADLIAKQTEKYAEDNSITLIQRRIMPDTPTLTDLIADLKSGGVKADAIYAGADSYVASVCSQIKEAAPQSMKMFGGTETFFQCGWNASLSPSSIDMGKAAADYAVQILKGKQPNELPVILPTPKMMTR
jgi:putative tryptophan/tyrosine transport system substrate-binding protein